MKCPQAYAVILAGGRGERFWPLSTGKRPKQFLNLFGGRALLVQAIDRLTGLIPPERVIVITSADLVEATREAAPDLPEHNIIGEPCGRDTAAASALACALVQRRDPQGCACILAADHLIGNIDIFQATLTDAINVACSTDAIVTIGMQPTYPATGFGYIESGDLMENGTATQFNKVTRFVEKPDEETATAYIASKRYYWNAGMFIWRAETMARALAQHTPALADLRQQIVAAPETGVAALLASLYPDLPKISVDYAIMEHAGNIVVARGLFAWDDAGAWSALATHFDKDASGNVLLGKVETLDASNNIVVSGDRLTALLGVNNLVVVHTGNATLVCACERVQEIKKIVNQVGSRPDGAEFV